MSDRRGIPAKGRGALLPQFCITFLHCSSVGFLVGKLAQVYSPSAAGGGTCSPPLFAGAGGPPLFTGAGGPPLFAVDITLFVNQNPVEGGGPLPVVCNQGLLAFLVLTPSHAGYQLTGLFSVSGMIFARRLVS